MHSEFIPVLNYLDVDMKAASLIVLGNWDLNVSLVLCSDEL